jgi:hypothetical protein
VEEITSKLDKKPERGLNRAHDFATPDQYTYSHHASDRGENEQKPTHGYEQGSPALPHRDLFSLLYAVFCVVSASRKIVHLEVGSADRTVDLQVVCWWKWRGLCTQLAESEKLETFSCTKLYSGSGRISSSVPSSRSTTEL